MVEAHCVDMAEAVAGEVLGPRPGLAIVSFWQGIVEIGLRAAAAVVSFSKLENAQPDPYLFARN